MRIDFSITVTNPETIEPLDIDLDVLEFKANGKEYCIDLVGCIDIGKEGNVIKGTFKSDGVSDLIHPEYTYEEILEAFNVGTDMNFITKIYEDTETDSKITGYTAEIQMEDYFKSISKKF